MRIFQNQSENSRQNSRNLPKCERKFTKKIHAKIHKKTLKNKGENSRILVLQNRYGYGKTAIVGYAEWALFDLKISREFWRKFKLGGVFIVFKNFNV